MGRLGAYPVNPVLFLLQYPQITEVSYMDENGFTKTELWAERIKAFTQMVCKQEIIRT